MSVKRYGDMMYPKNGRRNNKKCTCVKCKKKLTPRTAYYYVDGCNAAITNNAPPYCEDCYRETFG